jgi:hypothetical protein
VRVTQVLTVLAAGALALAVTGCSGDDDEPGDADATAPTAATVRPALVALWTGNDAAAGDDATATGECFADALLERVDPADLVDAGVLDVGGAAAPDQPHLDAETARAWVDAQFACSDFVAESTRALTAQTKGKLDARAYETCLRDALSDEQLRAAVEQSLQGAFDDPAVTRLARAQRTCATQALPAD